MKSRLIWLLTLLRDIILMPLVILMPRNRKKIVFGAWGGKQFGCNPKYLFEYLCRRGGFRCVWVGDKSLKADVLKVPNAHFAAKGSLLALWHCLTARFYAHNVQWRSDIINFPRCRRFEVLYLTHGFPDKKAGSFQYNGNGPEEQKEEARSWLRQKLHDGLVCLSDFLYGQDSWFSASSKQGEDLRVDGLPWRLSHDRALQSGIPRADFLITNKNNTELKKQLREKFSKILGIPTDKRWTVFVPTWRHDAKYLFSFATSARRLEYEKVFEANGEVLIEKQHPKTLEDMPIDAKSSATICLVTTAQGRQIDTQELLMACDRLITDYSSVYYDFVLMDRPVIHFIYDYDHFMNLDMGFMFDIKDYGGGPFAETEDELLRCLMQSDEELLRQRNASTIAEQLSYEKGQSCASYYNLIKRLSVKRGYFVLNSCLLRSFIAAFAYYCGLDAIFYWLNRRAKRIITFHNVLPDELFSEGVANGVSNKASDFEKIVDECAKRFKFSTDLFDAKTLTITFDDGYRNQYSAAFRSLQQRGIPAYLFVSGNCLENKVLVVDLLTHWVDNVPVGEYMLELPTGLRSCQINCGNRLTAWSEMIWPEFIKDSAGKGRNVLAACDKAYPMEKILANLPKDYYEERFCGVTASQCNEMRTAGWKIGWHTKSHYPLANLCADEIRAEIDSPTEFRDVCLSYPYGNPVEVGDSVVQMAKSLGYPYAVSNTNTVSENKSMYFLPRMSLPSDRYMLHFELSGLKHFLKFRKLLPISTCDCADVIAPSFEELESLAKCENVELRDISIYDDSNNLAARALCYVERRRHHGLNMSVYSLYSGKLHDYVHIWAKDKKSGQQLLQKIIEDAREQKCDIVCLESILAETVPEGLLRRNQEMKIFDSRRSKTGWRYLYDHKSVKRFKNAAKKLGIYHVEINNGDFTHSQMCELADLHVWRWGFAYESSPFSSNSYRIAQYENCTKNKVYIRVMLGGDILACHYGMIYGKSLLWHTPVINPKYLAVSPLRLLLAETAKWCESLGLEQIDFGLGDEAYKDGYCNAIRETAFGEYALSAKGCLAKLIGEVSKACKLLTRAADKSLSIIRSVRNFAQRLQERWLFYVSSGIPQGTSDSLFFRAKTWTEFCDFAWARRFPIHQWQWQRFKDDKSLCFVAMADDNDVYSYGWETYDFSVAKGYPRDLNGKRILYDFVTPEKFRNQGWYTRLLKRLQGDGPAVIYVNKQNIASKHAIEKAGFRLYREENI